MKMGFRSPVEEWAGWIRAEGRRTAEGQGIRDECSGRTRLSTPGHALGLVRRPRIGLLAKRLSWREPIRCNPAWSNPAWREPVQGWNHRAIAECGPRHGRRRARVRRQIPARGLRPDVASLFPWKTRWGFDPLPAEVRAESLRKGGWPRQALARKIGKKTACFFSYCEFHAGDGSSGRRGFPPSGHERQPLQ